MTNVCRGRGKLHRRVRQRRDELRELGDDNGQNAALLQLVATTAAEDVDEADPTPSFSPLGVKSGGLSLALTRAPGRPRFERRAAESEGRVPRCFRSGRLRRRAAGGCQSRERSRRAIFLSESASACERAAQRRHDALLDARAHFLQEARQALCYDEMYQRPFFFLVFFFFAT